MNENLEIKSKCKVRFKNRAVNSENCRNSCLDFCPKVFLSSISQTFFFLITWSGSSRHWPVIFLDMHNLSFAFAQWRLGLVRGEVKAKRKSRLGGEEGCRLVANS